MNRVVFVSLTILFLLSMSSITGLLQVAKAESGTITINADGSITPFIAAIYTADDMTYTLTGNITTATEGILIERSNIVLNGAGYTVIGDGFGSGNGIALGGMGNVTVGNMTITYFTVGIYLGYSSNCTLSGNNVTANQYSGIDVFGCSNCTLCGNNVANGQLGIDLGFSSSNCTLSGNNVAKHGEGILLDYSSNYNSISGNNITANGDAGIEVDFSCNNNVLSGNNIANNYWGIELFSSSTNSIYDNDFMNNTQSQVISSNSTNAWDNGSSGNYWSDYLTKYPNATGIGSSGVWNTPYVIDANNTDYFPLTVPIGVIPEFPSFLILPLFMIATLLTVIIYKKKGVKSTR
jgi:parallel beta-helix repeat protein